MARMSTREKARALLRDAIISLCRETIPHKDEISVDGLLGITVDQKDVFLVTIQEFIGGGKVKKKRMSDTSLGLTVQNVEGNASSIYYNHSDSGTDATPSSDLKERKRKLHTLRYGTKKRILMSNGSPVTSGGASQENSKPKPQTVNVMGESVEIKQEKPDSDDEQSGYNMDTDDWQLCVDQQQASNDESLTNEVLEMSAENLRNFTTLRHASHMPQGRRSSQIRLHEFSAACGDHRPHLIPPTARRSHPQKRCRVCYKQGLRKESRYCCPVCPGYPGLCVVPCFELYHADKSYQSQANQNFQLSLQEMDPMFDITQALGLSRKGQVLLKQDSIGRRTIVGNYSLSAAQAAAMAEEDVSDEEESMLIGNLESIEDGGRSIKSEDIDDEYETELVSDLEEQGKQGLKGEGEDEGEAVKDDSLLSDDETPPDKSASEQDEEEEEEGEEEGEGPGGGEQGEEEEEEENESPEDSTAEDTQEDTPSKKEEDKSNVVQFETADSLLTKIIKIEPTDYVSETPPEKPIEKKVVTLASRAPVTRSRSFTRLTSPTATSQKMSPQKVIFTSKPSSSSPVKLTSIISTASSQPTALRTSSGVSAPRVVTSGTSLLATNRAGGSRPPSVITLPPGALFSGGATTIKIPTAGSNTKTYMITKSESGAIKKTPIILKTVPVGSKLPVKSLSGGASTSLVGTAGTSGKTVYLTSKPTAPATSTARDVDKYTLDLVPTPTSLNTQVLKVLVGKPPDDGENKE